jgi:alginate O-acetyltransferase complex protein AlgI
MNAVVAILPMLGAIIAGAAISPWACMWLLAMAVWLGCKWIAWRHATQGNAPAHVGAAVRFFLGWPGMDPKPFLRATKPTCRGRRPRRLVSAMNAPNAAEDGGLYKIALARIAFGACLIAAACVAAGQPLNPLLIGWIGMIGTMFALHFGLFDLLAWIWNTRGVAVEPIMQHPFASDSLTEFWSRWNRGFRDIASLLIFRPLRKRIGPSGAMIATFLFSGLVHDLVISVPARGGFGLPTLYFMLQGFGILIDRSLPAKHAFARRILLYVTAAAPIGLLFHPPFVREIYVPFLLVIRHAFTAIGGA